MNKKKCPLGDPECEECPRYMDDCDGMDDWDRLSPEQQARANAEENMLEAGRDKDRGI